MRASFWRKVLRFRGVRVAHRDELRAKKKHDADEEIETQWMEKTDPASLQKLVRQPAGAPEEEPDASDEFGIPIQKRIEHVDNDVPERAVIIDGGLPAIRAIVAAQFRPAILAVRQRRQFLLRFPSPKAPLAPPRCSSSAEATESPTMACDVSSGIEISSWVEAHFIAAQTRCTSS